MQSPMIFVLAPFTKLSRINGFNVYKGGGKWLNGGIGSFPVNGREIK